MALTEREEFELLSLERERAMSMGDAGSTKLPGAWSGVTPGQAIGAVPQIIGQDIARGAKEVAGIAKGFAEMPYTALKNIWALGKAGVETVRGKQTPQQLAQRVGTGIKEDISGLAKPFTHPVQSFTEAPIGTALQWATIAFPAAKGLGVGAKAVSKAIGLSPEIETTMAKAIKPNKSNFNFNRDVKTAMPEISQTAEELKMPITNIEEFNTALKATKAKIWAQYEGTLKKAEVADKAKVNIFIDGDTIANEMIKSMDERFMRQNPAKVKVIVDKAESYRGRKLTPTEAEDFLQSANNELYSFYAKNKVGQKVAANDPEIGYVVKEASSLRNGLYSKLNQLTGEDVRGLKRLYGAVTNIEKESVGRAVVAGRQSPFSLQEQINYPFAVAKGVKSVLTGDVVGGAESIGQISLARTLKQANTTDNLIKSAFERYGKMKAAKTYGTGTMLKPK